MAKFIKATALYHDGKNNVQVNYSGESSKVYLNFKNEMDNRNVVWAHLFTEGNGQLLLSYGNIETYIEHLSLCMSLVMQLWR